MTEIKRPKKFKDKINYVVTDWLCVEYPNLFDIENPKPLAIGVGTVLQKKLPKHIDRKDYGLVIAWYCKKKRYLRAVISQQYRYDLNGEIAAEITEEEKIKAKELLEQIEEQIKAKQSAEKPVGTVLVQEPVQEISQPEVVEDPILVSEVIESEPVKKTLSLKSKKPSTTTEEVKPMINTKSEGMATAKGLKVTLVIDPASLPNIDTTGMKKAPISIFIANGEITATTEINAKSYRKALSSIEEYGVDGCNVIIQGSMRQYGVIDDAGLVVQPKKVATPSE